MKKIFYLIIPCSMLMLACKKEKLQQDVQSPSTSPVETGMSVNDPVLKGIYDMGFKEKDVVSAKDYYVILGDMLINKTPNSRQFSSPSSLVLWSKLPNVKVKVDASITNADWVTAISAAVTDWNNISGCRLKFSIITSGTPDITIKSDNGVLRDYLITDLSPYPVYYPQATAAELPYYGNPGANILVNLNVVPPGSPLNVTQKKYNISHSLGHAVGFLHTDWIAYDSNWPSHQNSYYHIPGSPGYGTNPDPSSLFNYEDLTRTISFSTADISAINYLYGSTVKRIALRTSNGFYVQAVNGGGGSVTTSSPNPWSWETLRLAENPLYGNAPYYTLQAQTGQYLQATNGGGAGVNASSANNWSWETFQLIPNALFPGKYSFKVKDNNYYLQATNGGGTNSTLVANSANPWEWESFTIVESIY
jgi:hypothetical protein